MFISFSGPDGAGKTTQINMLLNYLEEYGYSTASVYDVIPQNLNYLIGDDLKKVYHYFKDFDVIHSRFRLNSEMNAKIMNIVEFIDVGNEWLSTFSAYTSYYDAQQWYKYVNKPLIAAQKIVIADKYFYDDIAFKTAYGASYEWLKRLHYDTIIPDISLYFKVDYNTILEHNKERKDLKNTLYRKPENTKKLLDCYSQISMDYPICEIDATGTIQDTFNNVIKCLLAHPTFSIIINSDNNK